MEGVGAARLDRFDARLAGSRKVTRRGSATGMASLTALKRDCGEIPKNPQKALTFCFRLWHTDGRWLRSGDIEGGCRTDHGSGKGVTKLVKRRPSGTAGLKGGTSQGKMECHVPGVMGFGARQQIRGSLGLRQGCTEF